MNSTLSIQRLDMTGPQRETLADWQAQLQKLVSQALTCRARKVHGALGVQLASAIRGASAAVAEICAPAESELLGQAASLIAPYFRHAGDARNVARQFDAFTELRGFLRGPKGEDSLSGLANQAEAARELIGRILAGDEAWQFGGKKS